MQSKILEELRTYNFWDKLPANLGHRRDNYLNKLEESLGNNLIKVLIGQRRVGKSFVLRQFINELIATKKVNPQNILYINFEIAEFKKIKDAEGLQEYIEIYLKQIKPQKNKTIFFFFDEVQEVQGWETIINSYLANHTIKKEIFITGSNSKLLSSELSSYLTGRYLTINIYPYSYREHLEIKKLKATKQSFLGYFNQSQLPETYNLKNKEQIVSYISSVKDSILFRDIVQRYQIQNVDLLDKLFIFLVDNIGNPFSLNSIVKKLKAEGVESNTTTLGNYIKYFEESFVLAGLSRYDIKGKQILEGEKKYYVNDLGLKNYLFSSFDPGKGKLLENYVCNCLRQQGYKIHIGRIDSVEIDFVAEKNKIEKYIQVAYLLDSHEVVAREYGNLERIHNHWDKLVLTMDDIENSPKGGIKHIQAWDFENYLCDSR